MWNVSTVSYLSMHITWTFTIILNIFGYFIENYFLLLRNQYDQRNDTLKRTHAYHNETKVDLYTIWYTNIYIHKEIFFAMTIRLPFAPLLLSALSAKTSCVVINLSVSQAGHLNPSGPTCSAWRVLPFSLGSSSPHFTRKNVSWCSLFLHSGNMARPSQQL